MVFHTPEQLKNTYAKELRKQGQGVSVDAPVGEHGGTIDILTDREIIRCTLELTQKSAVEAKSQLDFYGRFCPHWQKVVACQQITDQSAADRLAKLGIKVVTVLAPSAALALRPQNAFEPRFVYSRKIDYKALEGGSGSIPALMVIAFVFTLGIIGLVSSTQRVSTDPADVSNVLRSVWQTAVG